MCRLLSHAAFKLLILILPFLVACSDIAAIAPCVTTKVFCSEPKTRFLNLKAYDVESSGETGVGIVINLAWRQSEDELPGASYRGRSETLQHHVTSVRLMHGRDSTMLFDVPLRSLEERERMRARGGDHREVFALGGVGGKYYDGEINLDELFKEIPAHGAWFEIKTNHPNYPVLRIWARVESLGYWARRCVCT